MTLNHYKFYFRNFVRYNQLLECYQFITVTFEDNLTPTDNINIQQYK